MSTEDADTAREGIIKGRPAESFFLPDDVDFVRAPKTSRLPDREYQILHGKIRQVLEPLVEEGRFQIGPGWYGETNTISSMDASVIVELGDELKKLGVETWQLAFVEPFVDDGVTFYKRKPKAREVEKRVLGAEHGIVDTESSEYLREAGYCESWTNVFPHVNFHHILELAKSRPDIFVAGSIQPLEIIPVPGVQIMSYSIRPVTTEIEDEDNPDGQPERQGWARHWGDKYNEDYKRQLRDLLLAMAKEGKLGDTVMDLGCGVLPVSEKLGGEDRRVILVDKVLDVEKMRKENFYPVCADVDNMSTSDVAERLEEIIGAPPRGKIDAVILSDILNYSSNWRQLLREVRGLMAAGGHIIISNMPDQGYDPLLSEDRPRTNLEVLIFLSEALGCGIEEVQDTMQVCGFKDKGQPIGRYGQMLAIARIDNSEITAHAQ